MSKTTLNDRIEKAKLEISLRQRAVDEAEDHLDTLYAKQIQYRQKRIRKAWRKKYRKDPAYRMMCRAVDSMFKTYSGLPEWRGLSAQIEEASK